MYLNNSTTAVNSSLHIPKSYTDNGYANDLRQYKVSAVDTNGVESIGRTVALPKLDATLAAGSSIQRGVMNQVNYTVVNGGAQTVSGVKLKVKVGLHNHSTLSLSMAAGETRTVPIIIGGYADLADTSQLSTVIEVTASTGERARIIRNQEIAVSNGAYLLGLQSQNMTRGTTGQLRFTWENTSGVQTDIVTALIGGKSSSNEVRFKLLDADGNVLTVVPFKQALGEGVVTLSSGKTVARMNAGASFTSQWINVPIPSSAPDQVIVKLEVDKYHYHLGAGDQVSISGGSSRRELSLIDTAYYGTVDSITPQSSFGDVPIVIIGRAIDRATTQPLASVPLKLIIAVKGFERVKDVFTDATGDYRYEYIPGSRESGIYSVSAIHPQVLDRPVHGQFTISSIVVSPNIVALNLPTNYTQTVKSITAQTGEGTTATNLRLEYVAANQPGGSFPQGVTISLVGPITMGSNQRATLPFTIYGDNTAAPSGSIILKAYANETRTGA